MNDKQILELTVAQLNEKLHNRELSSADVTEAYIARIDETDGEICAYITKTYDLARENARKADEKLKQSHDVSALVGVPFAVKDNIAVENYRMTCASRMLENFVPPYTATVVEKAGGIVLGKTNLDEFAMGSSGEKSIIGASHNPLDKSRSTGGSSGGSAAATAAKMAPWAIGTDTGGSARQPASFCGLVSMKPTYGIISRYGVTELASSMDTVSPMTRDVYDNAMVLEAISGKDERDMTSLDPTVSFTTNIENGVQGMKIGLMRGIENYCGVRMTSAIERSAKLLERLGATVELIDIPEPEPVINTYVITTAAEASSNLARYDGLKYGYSVDADCYTDIMEKSRSEGFGEEVKRRIMAGAYILSSTISGEQYRHIMALRQNLCEQMDDILSKYDALLMPTASGKAFGKGGFEDDPTAMYNSDSFTAMANLTGCPAISLPCGGDGILPYGAMFMGAKMTEDKLYRIAYALEQELKIYIEKEVSRVVL